MIIGVISDTHGLLRPQVLEVLKGSRRILHAGDIGDPQIIARLQQIAPVTAVRGNNDTGDWAREFPERHRLEVADRRIYMLHDMKELAIDPAGEGIDVVIAGHSHKPLVEKRGKVLFLNPGSAGPRRFKLPVTVARLSLSKARMTPRIIELGTDCR